VQRQEPSLAGFVHSYVLMHERSGLGRALASLLANKLSSRTLLAAQLQGLFLQAYEEDPVGFLTVSCQSFPHFPARPT
jgi:Serine acetyltransferase, N-terminal